MARAWDAMSDWFEVLPQAPCAVEGTTTGAKAFYFPPASDGSRGGTFFVNVTDPTAWGTFELEAMAFHEGIPGHHLQLAIAGELTAVPEFRKHMHNSAYAEGWGLYTERLSDEMGLYSGPVERLGMLSADSMRASRLVVDTGLHALGWSREQAVQFMLDNSPLSAGVVPPGDRPLRRVAGTGDVVHDRAARDPAAAARGGAAAGRRVRRPRVPLGGPGLGLAAARRARAGGRRPAPVSWSVSVSVQRARVRAMTPEPPGPRVAGHPRGHRPRADR